MVNNGLSAVVPAQALVHAHISEAPIIGNSMEALKTILEGDRAGRPRGWISVPAAELRDDPGGPAKACFGVGVFLERCLAFEPVIETIEHSYFIRCERDGGGLGGRYIAGLEQLQGDDGSLGGDGGELDQTIGGLHLTVFESQALLLQQPPELLDGPTHFVPVDDLPGSIGIGDLMRGEKTPVYRSLAARRIAFDHLDERQRYRLRQIAIGGIAGASQFDFAEPHAQGGQACGTLAFPFGQFNQACCGECKLLRRGIEAIVIGQAAIMHGACNQVDVRSRHPCPGSEDIALAVAEHSNHGGASQHDLSLVSGRDPTMRLFVLGTALLVRDPDAAAARPDLPSDQTQTAAVGRVNRHHAVQQQAPPAALGFAQSAPPSRSGVEINLAGVLDRQHMPASGRNRGLLTPSLDQPISRHSRICEKSPKPNLQRPLPIPCLPQANRGARNHAMEKHRPLLSRRPSPNRPNDISSSDIATLRDDQSVNHRMTRQCPNGTLRVHPDSLRPTSVCASTAVKARTDGIKKRFELSSSSPRNLSANP